MKESNSRREFQSQSGKMVDRRRAVWYLCAARPCGGSWHPKLRSEQHHENH